MPAGRPTVVTPEVLRKLEEAFLLDCTDAEACLHANIATSTLYKYQDENKEFIERKQELKNNPFLIARNTLIEGIKKDPELALKYMERKKKKEFSLRTEVTGENGEALKVVINDYTAGKSADSTDIV